MLKDPSECHDGRRNVSQPSVLLAFFREILPAVKFHWELNRRPGRAFSKGYNEYHTDMEFRYGNMETRGPSKDTRRPSSK